MRERLFVLQVVIVVEESYWTGKECGPPDRIERTYGADDCLFAADDEETAYSMASDWVGDPENQERSGAYFDANHDGPGDLTKIFALGIHQLREVTSLDSLDEAIHEPYGLGLPGFYFGDVDSSGVPLVRKKEDLEVFRVLRLLRRDPEAT